VILPAVWATASPSRKKTLPEIVEQKKTAPELAFYRKYTEGMLRRYVRLSMEAGRAPSLLGREMFRGKVTSYRVHSFEDVVIFVHDVETCLKKLNEEQQHLIRRIALQEFTQAETAGLLGLSLRSVHRQYADALDELTEIFLERKLLEPAEACQEAGTIL
jgi:Sigma-70, region 4